MITLALINTLILLSIFGYSYFFKAVYLKDNSKIIKNIDFFYGFIFLYFLALLLHLFAPLKYFSKFIIFIGILAYIFGLIKGRFKINFFLYFIIIFLFSIISFSGSDNVDSPLYHLQIINWLTEYKLSFGISNLQIRLGTNYPWYSIISILNFDLNNFSNKYYINLIIFSFILYEIVTCKKKNYSFIFFCIAISYLFFYSLVHPFKYGVILNHFGNPEKDIFNMLLFFTFIYFYIYLFENLQNKDLSISDENIINLVIITGVLLLMQSQMYVFILFLIFLSIFSFKNYKIFSKINIFLIIVITGWVFKSFTISGCFFFPFSFTCLDVAWATEVEKIDYFKNETLRHNRSLPSKNIISDLHLTIETFKWFKFWFKDYYLTTALHQINTIIVFFCLLTLTIIKFLKKNILVLKSDVILIISIILVNLTCMLNPEIRYAWGPHISFSSILLLLVIKLLGLREKTNIYFISFIPIALIVIFIFIKVPFNINFNHLIKLPERFHDMSNKSKIGNFNGFEVFSNGWKCADMVEICVNIPRDDYQFDKKNSFLFIK